MVSSSGMVTKERGPGKLRRGNDREAECHLKAICEGVVVLTGAVCET